MHFSFFHNFGFLGCWGEWGGGGGKWQKIMSLTLYLGTVPHMIVCFGTHV